MITVREVSKSFSNQRVLNKTSLTCQKGEILGLLGPNGAGKTTLIRVLNGVILPDSGEISINGYDPVIDGHEIRKVTGIVTESAGLYHQMNAVENLAFFADIYGVKNKSRIYDLLRQFGLDDHKSKPIGTYSTGMKKRLALAKALLHEPSILYLDEPTNGLDPDGISMVLSYLKEYNYQNGTTVLICSHVLHQLENVCSSFAFLDNGHIIDSGSLLQLQEKYSTHIKLNIHTNMKIENGNVSGFPCEQLENNHIRVTVNHKDEISPLLKNILLEHWIHSVAIEEQDLESIYFMIRSRNNE
ncbi:ABC transporter ATP-binding protein [Lysinibacillus yapensis]|uniref:ABC transporter ATP-binding protein n=1 Tax=Ureibacillus yapensis TaxID=2304605 RepID=UPI00131404A5|nr:ABC transporter ATP-binding protein [Lysinibacillus yapensis]